MSAPPLEESLPAGFRRGLEAIRNRHVPEAQVVAVRENAAYITLGKMMLPEGLYTAVEAEVFVRAPLAFPDAVPYGLVTRPVLHRVDGRPLEAFHLSHLYCQHVAEALDASVGEFAFFSWQWQGVPNRTPEDLAHIVEWARKRVRMGVPT